MNVTQLFEFQLSKLNESQYQDSEGNALIAYSMRPIIEEVFMRLAPSFVIVISCRRKKEYNLYMNVLQYLFNILPDMFIQLVYVNHNKPLRVDGPRYVNLLLIDSFESFLDIDVISYTKGNDFNEYYYIFLLQLDRYIDSDMQRIFQYCWHNQILNSNIEFLNAQGELHMFTYFPFGPHTCDNAEPQHINQYVEGEWLRKPYFFPKVKNLYGCPLVGLIRDISFYSQASNFSGILMFKGLETDLLGQMADVMNFTTVFQQPLVDDRQLLEIGGGGEMLQQRLVHFSLGYYRKRISTSNRFSTSSPHYQSSIVTVINYKGHKLKSFEMLAYPFKGHTWIAVAVCFALTLWITKYAHCRNPRSIRAFSIIGSSLGAPMHEKPYRLDSICIYIPWLWSTLIMRAMYSGVLYHLFSTNVYHSLPETIEEAHHAQYASVMNDFTFKDIQGIAYYNLSNVDQNSIVIRSNNEMAALDYLVRHPESNALAVVAHEFFMHYAAVNNAGGDFYIIPEVLMQQQLCFYLPKHSFLIDQFDTVLNDLKAVGYVRLLMRRHLDTKYLINTIANDDKMIHQGDLQGIYMTCGCLYFVAFGVFILELLSKKFEWLRKLFQLMETINKTV